MRYAGILALLFLLGCETKKPITVVEESLPTSSALSLGNETLSSYGFFVGQLKDLQPAPNVFPYDLNSPLFSDYAQKKRFIKLPDDSQVTYNGHDVLDFPDGAILIKNFYYPQDFRRPEEEMRILETRLLLKENGEWRALPYVWNDEQTEAFLEVAGENIEVSWIDEKGTGREVLYSVPNVNQCAGCHIRGEKIMPIGPTARQLNKGNQMIHWSDIGILKDVPAIADIPRLSDYSDEGQPLELRARAWLEVNCAHCHRPDGPAKTSGLHLLADVSNPYELGIGKAPVAAGRGSGGLKYDIVPGHPEESILFHRIQSDDPGVMMPELGKKLVHDEGVELVRRWIANMKQ